MFRLLIDSATKQNVGDTSVHAVLGTGIHHMLMTNNQALSVYADEFRFCFDVKTQIEKR